VARRHWDEQGGLVATHGEYPEVVRALAAEQRVPLIDLEYLTSQLYREYGEEDSKRLHLWFSPGEHPLIPAGISDNTHYSELGARRVAGMVAEAIRKLELPLAQWLLTPDIVVAADGSGDFISLQRAIYQAPWLDPKEGRRWHIRVKRGTYHERVYVQRERGQILVRGDDPLDTVIAMNLHAKMEGPDGKPIGTFATATVTVDGDGMIWEDLTIANTAGPVAQALALRADGDRLVFRRCRFLGWQDTVFVNRGRHYFEDCSIEGHVDFIFGGATAYFSRCHLHCLGNGYITAASTPAESPFGMVFHGGIITTASGVKTYLGRPWRNDAKTAFIATNMDGGIRPEGWHNWGRPEAERTIVYLEYGNSGDGALLVNRVPWMREPTDREIALLSDPVLVLAGSDGWNPLLHR
jgi:pectinesterase